MCCTMIERIETAGPGSKARRLVFDDGSEPRLTSAAVLRERGLKEGDTIWLEDLENALSPIEYRLAKERALRLLGYREHSAAELRGKLRDSGYPQAVAAAVTDRFVEVELVDDARFAGLWTRSRIAAGYGPRRIRRELSQRGIDADLIDRELSESFDPREELGRARAALGSHAATDRAGRERLVRRLVSKGFSLSIALRAVEGCEDVVEE
jgi:SOS response regulatory protein OraA/RecX